MYFSDAEKAFNNVYWVLLKAALKKMGSGKAFKAWITHIYSVLEVEIWLEGCKLRKFSIYRGVPQGCPLSPLLFSIMIEMLAIAVWQQKGIVEIHTQITEHKILLYADNAVFLLQNLVVSLLKILELVLQHFADV